MTHLKDLQVIVLVPDQKLNDHLLAKQENVVFATLLAAPTPRYTPVAQLVLSRSSDFLPSSDIVSANDGIWRRNVEDDIATADVIDWDSDLCPSGPFM